MKKISLKLDALTVESFETGAAAAKDGTVHAQEAISAPNPCIPRTQIQTCDRGLTCTDALHACICIP
ncbi:MAG TPA: hypothetical protein VM890_00625 [Longimicrobium sp.]|jgi:hypothetical protein|nr:hypothetical protein [Longimicrobium sp.]